METIRLSVRQLVEFSFPGEDLVFTGLSMQAMADGALAHRQRQAGYTEPWVKEVPLSITFKKELATFIISGRMDGFFEDPLMPTIEEIKLFSAAPPPTAPLPVHLAQGLCYAHILCQTRELPQALVQVTYVDKQGEVLATFTQSYTSAYLEEQFNAYVNTYYQWEEKRIVHQQKRDASLQALLFPFNEYRAGQREMSIQVYTAIKQKKRLLASLPTGTGKSAAVLFPAMKSLGENHTRQLFYLTARNTGKESPLKVMEMLRCQPLVFRALSLTAKEKVCPHTLPLYCNDCPYATGFFLRLPQALEDFFALGDWTEETVSRICQSHQICPFETALILSEVADLVICDYNYAFDPTVRLQRIFERPNQLSLLVDEAHHLPDRARDMLSAVLSGPFLHLFRKNLGKSLGRTHSTYKLLSSLLSLLRTFPTPVTSKALEEVFALCQELYSQLQITDPAISQALNPDFLEVLRGLYAVGLVKKQPIENYAILYETKGKEGILTLYATNVADYLREVTTPFHGTVYFSATLTPLRPMGTLLGADDEDGYFSLPSPFPKEHLLVLRKAIDTRYQARVHTAVAVAQEIIATYMAHPGKYMVYFPSFAYLHMVYQYLEAQAPHLPYQLQASTMAQQEREAFVAAFLEGDEPLLGLCVLGGIFSEGIDLPGSALIGTIIVGVGLPMISPKQEALKESLSAHFGSGFAYAYQYPGMQKVLQAAGRVIRSEKDYGVVVLIDRRYFDQSYINLCPGHWQFDALPLARFWAEKPNFL